MKYLSTQPYKGARDFYPGDMRIQNYIYDSWKDVCKKFGFEEYNFPILEPLELFASKTGEEIVNEQLFSFEDRGGRQLAIRPELTPGTVRMIAQKFKELSKPIKWFMIGNNWRFEKPQTGRGREFNQLEANIFGISGVEADFEIIKLIISIMTKFGARKDMYRIKINDRRLVNSFLTDTLGVDVNKQNQVRRLMDKRGKLDGKEFDKGLKDLGVEEVQVRHINHFLESDFETVPVSKENQGYCDLSKLFSYLKEANLMESVSFSPSVIRGFDYSDGIVYEVFDTNPKNKRSLFGGERYDNLIKLFGNNDLPATGFAMGDYTLLEFLKGWNLLPNFKNDVEYLVTVWPSDSLLYFSKSMEVADGLRAWGRNVVSWLSTNTKLDKQMKYADRNGIRWVVIVGDEEINNKKITIKDLTNGTQETISWPTP